MELLCGVALSCLSLLSTGAWFLSGVAWKIVLKNVIFPEVLEKASKKIEKKCYSSRKELENE